MAQSSTVNGTSKAYGSDELRLITKIARMYYERGVRQHQIAAQLHMSQSRVSRLLQQAREIGIVRITVTLPAGVYPAMEDDLKAAYDLLDSVIVDADGASGDLSRALGAAAATYLRETLSSGDTVGISSWSPTLLATAEAMRPKTGLVVRAVTQLVGDIGDPRVQVDTARLVDRFANLTGARPVLFQPPDRVRNQARQRALLRDPAVADVLETWKQLTVALMGVGSVQRLPLWQRSSDPTDGHEQADFGRLGAVAHVCLRLLDQDGNLVKPPFKSGILGMAMGPERLKAVPRRIGIAGGPQEQAAVAAAIKGGWINTLITDLNTARQLLQDHSGDNG